MRFWFEVFVPGLPETKGSWRHIGKGRMKRDNPREKAWAELVGWKCKEMMKGSEPTPDPVCVVLDFYLPQPKGKRNQRDIDKMARSCLDAMTSLVYRDDEQVVELVARKRVTTKAKYHGASIQVMTPSPWPSGYP